METFQLNLPVARIPSIELLGDQLCSLEERENFGTGSLDHTTHIADSLSSITDEGVITGGACSRTVFTQCTICLLELESSRYGLISLAVDTLVIDAV